MKRKFTLGKSFGLHIISGHVSESMQRKSRFWPLLTQQTHINPPESFYAETMSKWNAKIMFFSSFFLSIPYSRLWVTVIFLLQCILYIWRYTRIYTYIMFHSNGTIISVSTRLHELARMVLNFSIRNLLLLLLYIIWQVYFLAKTRINVWIHFIILSIYKKSYEKRVKFIVLRNCLYIVLFYSRIMLKRNNRIYVIYYMFTRDILDVKYIV